MKTTFETASLTFSTSNTLIDQDTVHITPDSWKKNQIRNNHNLL